MEYSDGDNQIMVCNIFQLYINCNFKPNQETIK